LTDTHNDPRGALGAAASTSRFDASSAAGKGTRRRSSPIALTPSPPTSQISRKV
jgi:hypothetical protein